MTTRKKSLIIISLIMIIILILYIIFVSVYTKLSSAKKLYNGAAHSVSTLFGDFISSIDKMYDVETESHTIDIYLRGLSNSPFSSISFSDNSKSEYIEMVVNDLKISGNKNIDLIAFANSNKVGVGIGSNPEIYYIANGKRFRSKWNNSIYSKLVQIPDYIPDNLNYTNISSVLSGKNIFKVFLGMGMGKSKISIKDIISRISISEPRTYMLFRENKNYSAEKLSLSLPKNFIIEYVKKLRKSSESAEFDYMYNIFMNTELFLENILDENINTEVVIYENKLFSVETAFLTLNGLYNLRFDFSEDFIKFNVIKFGKYKTDKSSYCLNFSNSGVPSLDFKYIKDECEVMCLNVKKKSKDMIYTELVYCNENANKYIASATYKAVSKNAPGNIRTRDIYTLSVRDIFKLYSNFN